VFHADREALGYTDCLRTLLSRLGAYPLMAYQAPKHLLEVLQKIEYEEALQPGDPRYVDTTAARGSQKTHDRLARKFGLLLSDGTFYPPRAKHVLFFGHTGSGKTTELRRYAKELSGPGRFLVVEVDVTVALDSNNLQYADALMAMAEALLSRVRSEGLSLSDKVLQGLREWFDERVLTSEEATDFGLELKTGAEVKASLPFLLKLFATFTSAFKANATYKDALRRVIRNSFTQFAHVFNELLARIEALLEKRGLARRVLFLIDGTDKLRGEDTRRFFVFDAEQLLAIDANIIYTAPLSLKYEGNIAGKLDSDLVLPMIKLEDRDGARCEEGWNAMRAILLKRAHGSLFTSQAESDALVAHSGGHPRELLRLLKLCCEFAEENVVDANTARLSIQQLASEYRRFLEPEDYALLVKLDHDDIHSGNDERTRKLLYHLALLEYNDGAWRRSHPVIRTLEGYAQEQRRFQPTRDAEP
jgi:hypothetical protein